MWPRDLWPHLLVMVVLGAVALRRSPVIPAWTLLIAAAFGTALLTVSYRRLNTGILPPIAEEIGLSGWIASVLMVAIPLLAILVSSIRVRSSARSRTRQFLVVTGVGVIALAAFPFYGLIYCVLTGICP